MLNPGLDTIRPALAPRWSASNSGTIAASFARRHGYLFCSAECAGIAFRNLGTIVASYSDAHTSNLWSPYSGLVRENEGTIRASYALISGGGALDYRGLVRIMAPTTATIESSYYSRPVPSAGGTRKTAAELQAPTGYTGIYADWNVDTDGDGVPDDPWYFGSPDEYPQLRLFAPEFAVAGPVAVREDAANARFWITYNGAEPLARGRRVGVAAREITGTSVSAARAGVDFTARAGEVAFFRGSARGTTRAFAVAVADNAKVRVPGDPLRFAVVVGDGAASSRTTAIADDDTLTIRPQRSAYTFEENSGDENVCLTPRIPAAGTPCGRNAGRREVCFTHQEIDPPGGITLNPVFTYSEGDAPDARLNHDQNCLRWERTRIGGVSYCDISAGGTNYRLNPNPRLILNPGLNSGFAANRGLTFQTSFQPRVDEVALTCVDLAITDDRDYEMLVESAFLTLTSAITRTDSGANLISSVSNAEISIRDNENRVSIAQIGGSRTVREGEAARYRLTLARPVRTNSAPVAIPWRVTPGTVGAAASAADFTGGVLPQGRAVIERGAQEVIFEVTPLQDGQPEPAETYRITTQTSVAINAGFGSNSVVYASQSGGISTQTTILVNGVHIEIANTTADDDAGLVREGQRLTVLVRSSRFANGNVQCRVAPDESRPSAARTAAADFAATTTTAVFPNQTDAICDFDVARDDAGAPATSAEGLEHFLLIIEADPSSPIANASYGAPRALRIAPDPMAVPITVSGPPSAVVEGADARFLITLQGTVSSRTEVVYTLEDASATGGRDADAPGADFYPSGQRRVVLAPGTDPSAEIVVATIADGVAEGVESFRLRVVSAATNGFNEFGVGYRATTFARAATATAAVARISDGMVSITRVGSGDVIEGERVAFDLTLNRALPEPLAVRTRVTRLPDGAAAVADVTDATLSTFHPGAPLVQRITLATVDDGDAEGRERFRVAITPPEIAGGGYADFAIATSTLARGRVNLACDEAVVEGDGFACRVRIGAPDGVPADVDVTMGAGAPTDSATRDEDYTPPASACAAGVCIVTIAAGTDTAALTFATRGDDGLEADEQATVSLAAVRGGGDLAPTLPRAGSDARESVVRIVDDGKIAGNVAIVGFVDAAGAALPARAITNGVSAVFAEGARAAVRVTFDGTIPQGVTVPFDYRVGAAGDTAGRDDYTPSAPAVRRAAFAGPSTGTVVSLRLADDDFAESTETLTIELLATAGDLSSLAVRASSRRAVVVIAAGDAAAARTLRLSRDALVRVSETLTYYPTSADRTRVVTREVAVTRDVALTPASPTVELLEGERLALYVTVGGTPPEEALEVYWNVRAAGGAGVADAADFAFDDANADGDYDPLTGVLRVPRHRIGQRLPLVVPVVADAVAEGSETFEVAVSLRDPDSGADFATSFSARIAPSGALRVGVAGPPEAFEGATATYVVTNLSGTDAARSLSWRVVSDQGSDVSVCAPEAAGFGQGACTRMATAAATTGTTSMATNDFSLSSGSVELPPAVGATATVSVRTVADGDYEDFERYRFVLAADGLVLARLPGVIRPARLLYLQSFGVADTDDTGAGARRIGRAAEGGANALLLSTTEATVVAAYGADYNAPLPRSNNPCDSASGADFGAASSATVNQNLLLFRAVTDDDSRGLAACGDGAPESNPEYFALYVRPSPPLTDADPYIVNLNVARNALFAHRPVTGGAVISGEIVERDYGAVALRADADAAVEEGGVAAFTVTYRGPAQSYPVRVPWRVAPAPADAAEPTARADDFPLVNAERALVLIDDGVARGDPLFPSGVVTFAAGTADGATAAVVVRVRDDREREPRERFSVVLGAPTVPETTTAPAPIVARGYGRAVAAIAPSDDPAFALESTAGDEVAEGATLTVVVRAAAAANAARDLRCAITQPDDPSAQSAGAARTAATASDFDAAEVEVQLAAGARTATCEFPVRDDTETEGYEYFGVALTVDGVAVGARREFRIAPSDASVTVSGPRTAPEGTTRTYTVVRRGAAGVASRVSWRTTGTSAGFAAADLQSGFRSGVVTLPASPASLTSATFQVKVVDDTAAEVAERFAIVLAVVAGDARLGEGSSLTVVIPTSDVVIEPLALRFDASSYTVVEDTGELAFELIDSRSFRPPASATLTFEFPTARNTSDVSSVVIGGERRRYPAAGTAVAVGFDLDGATRTRVTVDIRADTIAEENESFLLRVSDAGGAEMDTATVTIVDDETVVMGFTFDDTIAETRVNFSVCAVVLRPLSTQILERTLNFAFALEDELEAPLDPGEYNFPVGQQVGPFSQMTRRQCFAVEFGGDDDVVEGTEYYIPSLTGLNGGSLPERVTVTRTRYAVTSEDLPLMAFDPTAYTIAEGDVAQVCARAVGPTDPALIDQTPPWDFRFELTDTSGLLRPAMAEFGPYAGVTSASCVDMHVSSLGVSVATTRVATLGLQDTTARATVVIPPTPLVTIEALPSVGESVGGIVNEGGVLGFRAVKTRATNEPVTVAWRISADARVATTESVPAQAADLVGYDALPAIGTVVIAPGMTHSEDILIRTANAAGERPTRTFVVTLFSLVGVGGRLGTPGALEATATIRAAGDAPTWRLALEPAGGLTLSEQAAAPAQFRVVLRRVSGSGALAGGSLSYTVSIEADAGSANPIEADDLASSSALSGSFNANQSSGSVITFSLTANDDDLNEGAEGFLIRLNSTDTRVVTTATLGGTIAPDADDAVHVSLTLATTRNVAEPGRALVTTMTWGGATLSEDLVLPFVTTAGDPYFNPSDDYRIVVPAGSDGYRVRGGALVVSPGAVTSSAVLFEARDDRDNESTESAVFGWRVPQFESAGAVTATVTAPPSGSGEVAVWIAQNDRVVYYLGAFSRAVVAKGGELEARLGVDKVNVDYTAPATRTLVLSGPFFETVTRTVVNEPPDITRPRDIYISFPDDGLETPQSEVTLTLHDAVGGRPGGGGVAIDPARSAATVIQLASEAVAASLSGPDEVREGATATYTLSLSRAWTHPTTVEYRITTAAVAGAAATPRDLRGVAAFPTTASAVIPAARTTVPILIHALDDGLFEGRERFVLELLSARDTRGNDWPLSDARRIVAIAASDPPRAGFEAPRYVVRNGSTLTACVSVDVASVRGGDDFSLTVTSADGVGADGAVAGADYVALSGAPLGPFSEATPRHCVRVPITRDGAEIERNEEFTLTLAAATTNVELTRAEATVEIRATDRVPPYFIYGGRDAIAYAGGQSRLWLPLNEPVKILGAGEAMAAATASGLGRDARLGGFVVLRRLLGTFDACAVDAMATTIAVTRAYYEAAAATPSVVLELARPIPYTDDRLWASYCYQDGPGIYDLAVESGMADPEIGRNQLTRSLGMMEYDPIKDSDGDGLPDALEARLGGDPLSPAGAPDDVPRVTLTRGVADTALIAYAGIREHGARRHLGVEVSAAGGYTLRAYYLSDTFGYTGDAAYGCRGRFPSNYDAPLADGGCAEVDFANIPAGVDHVIGWFAAGPSGYWFAAPTASGLPQQTIRRVPELNVASRLAYLARAGGEGVVLEVDQDAAPAAPLQLLLEVRTGTDVETRRVPLPAVRGRVAVVTATAAGTYGIAGVASGTANLLWHPARGVAALAATSYSLGVATRTRVSLLPDVSLLLGPMALTQDGAPRTVLHSGGYGYRLELPVRNPASRATMSDVNTVVAGGDVALRVTRDAAGVSGRVASRDEFEIKGDAHERVATAEFLVGFSDVRPDFEEFAAPARYSWPVIAPGDADADGVPDAEDDYAGASLLPVRVLRTTAIETWHHLRTVLPTHRLHTGAATRERVRARERAGQAVAYADYVATLDAADDPLYAEYPVVYDFEIYGVAPSTFTAAGRTVGGGAGVIMPLPNTVRAMVGRGLVPSKLLPSGERRDFDTTGENGYGFAPLDDQAQCPDDGARYRDSDGNLENEASVAGDACLLLWIVDGGANDADGVADGVIRDPTVVAQPIVMMPPPDMPTGLAAATASASVTLTWNDPGDAAITEYEYCVRTAGAGVCADADWMTILGSNADTVRYTVTGLVNGTRYTFELRAVNAGGPGAATTVDATPMAPIGRPMFPAAPTSLTVSVADAASLTLEWETPPSATTITSYQYRYRIRGGDWGTWMTIAGSGPDTVRYTVSGLMAGRSYFFQVRAGNRAGFDPDPSGWSEEKSGMPTATSGPTDPTDPPGPPGPPPPAQPARTSSSGGAFGPAGLLLLLLATATLARRRSHSSSPGGRSCPRARNVTLSP